jgi:hypothetical protein
MSESKLRQPDVIPQGQAKLINFNHEQVTRTGEDGLTEAFWRCEQVRVHAYASRGAIISAIIRNKYDEPGQEAALINNAIANPEEATAQAEYAEYQQRRQMAKAVADSIQ